MSVSVVLGDITLSHADAIVNAANCSLLGGSGILAYIICALIVPNDPDKVE